MPETTKNRYGFSKKTNVALGAFGALGLIANNPAPVTIYIACMITVIAVVHIILQYRLDNRKPVLIDVGFKPCTATVHKADETDLDQEG